MLWLLLTGKIPTEAETRQLSRELADKGELPSHVEKLLDSYVPNFLGSRLLSYSMILPRISVSFPKRLIF